MPSNPNLTATLVPVMTNVGGQSQVVSILASGNLFLVRLFAGGGPPSATTLPAPPAGKFVVNAQFISASDTGNPPDLYFDTSGKGLWACIVSGNNASSQWTQISGGGGSTPNQIRGLWTPTPTSPYMTYDIVILQTGTSTGMYMSFMDNNTNSPDSGVGWLQTGTTQSSWA